MISKKLSQKTLNAITFNGSTDFPTYSKPKPGEAAFLFYLQNDKILRVFFPPFCRYAQKVFTFTYSVSGGKLVTQTTNQKTLLGRNGNYNDLPSPGPTPLQDGLPVFASHPLTETMGSFPADSARLISSFAHYSKLPVYVYSLCF